jgi:hypothetical protein
MGTHRVRSVEDIGAIIHRAVVFDSRRWRGATVNEGGILENVRRLFSALCERQIDYVVVGGIALLQYVPGRNTEAIDLILSTPSLARLPELLIEDRNLSFARGKFGNLRVDLLLAEDPVFHKIRNERTTIQHLLEQDIRCATIEGSILLKLYALPSIYRQGDFARVSLYEMTSPR